MTEVTEFVKLLLDGMKPRRVEQAFGKALIRHVRAITLATVQQIKSEPFHLIMTYTSSPHHLGLYRQATTYNW